MPARTVKPMTLSLMSKAYTCAGAHRAVIVALGYFKLGEPVTRFLNEHEAAPRIFAALPKGEPLDALYPKACGELLLIANAHAVNGKPVNSMNVRVQIGEAKNPAIDKTLKVTGDRSVKTGILGQRVSNPQPFITMPLDWAHAYGGPSHACNQSGIGYTGKRSLSALPNVEYPDKAVRHGNQKLIPAGFGPRSVLCPDRQKRMGTFDQRWKAQYAPHLPADFKPAAFNAAPPDQQLNGWFRGGESYRLEGLHPSQPVMQGQLPDFRVRMLVLRQGQQASEAEAVEVHFDTVWLVPHLGLGVAVYRAEVACADLDGEDISALFAAYEDRHANPRSLTHYRDTLAARIDPATRHLHVFNDTPLSPALSADAIAARRARMADAEASKLAEQQALLDELDAEFWAEHPDLSKPDDHTPPKAQPSPLGFITAEGVLNGDVDLGDVIAKAQAKIEAVKQDAEAKLAELEQRRQTGDLAELERNAATQPKPDPAEQLAKDKADAAERASAQPRSPLADAIDAARDSGKVDAAQIQAMIEADAKLVEMQRKARAMSPSPSAEPVSPVIAAYLRELVELWLAQGDSLANRDLRGADLSGLDLSGQDLSRCNLESADLRSARLRKANLHEASLTAAQLADAVLDGADLTQASLNQVQAQGASLRGAILNQVIASDAAFTGADLSDVRAATLVLTGADLRGAVLDGTRFNKAMLVNMQAPESRWHGAVLNETIAYGAQLAAASLDHAQFTKVVLTGAEAPNSRWQGARFTKTLLNLAKLGGADFRHALGSQSCWRGSQMHRSDWRDAGMHRCDLGEALLPAADLRNASFGQCLLMRANLNGADARGTDFFQAMLRKTDLRNADLRDANLVRALDEGADYRDARLDGAVRTKLGEAA
ncbi:MAG: DUF2169 domain-containing protein [Gammaproteobacteria bacterium]|nr:DUF2169 domain-containing protein [Gammaproteobacteria bacterium]MCP5135730.1 DUF2169 domain-containing protein [Gammaproteobacteria bacterium]